jgi:hypothetical protein
MKRYRDRKGNSGVVAYEATKEAIVIMFADGGKYLYDKVRPGLRHIRNMKALAEVGMGLATYINRHVRGNYAKKLP